MSIRAKVMVASIKRDAYSSGAEIRLVAHYDDTIPEDQRFVKYTPTAEFTMRVDNPAVLERMTLGKKFYADFTEVPE